MSLLSKISQPLAGAGSIAASELADPRYELVQKLLEYKKFKEAAA